MWEINWCLKNIEKIRMASFICSHCGRWYRHEKGLKRHVRSSHTNQPLFTCTGRGVAVPTVVIPVAKKCCTGVPPERLQFKLVKH